MNGFTWKQSLLLLVVYLTVLGCVFVGLCWLVLP